MGKEIDAFYRLTLEEVHPTQKWLGYYLSPDTSSICYVWQRHITFEDSENRIVSKPIKDFYSLNLKNGYLDQITNLGDIENVPDWAPNSQQLILERAGGLEVFDTLTCKKVKVHSGSLYHSPVVQSTTGLKIGDAQWTRPQWSPNGKQILFVTKEDTNTSLVLVTADGLSSTKIYTHDGHIISWSWAPTGDKVVFVTREHDGWTGQINALDLASLSCKVISKETDFEYQKPIALWTPDGDRIIFRSCRTGWSKIWIYTFSNQELSQLTTGNWDDNSFRISPDGTRLVYSSKEGEDGLRDGLWVLNFNGGKRERLNVQNGLNVPLGWIGNGEIIYWHSSPEEPPSICRRFLASDEKSVLLIEGSSTTTKKLATPLAVKITKKHTDISSLIYRPVYFKDEEKYPAIVWAHGGPTMLAQFEYQPQYSWLANEGFIVIVPNFAGSIGLGVDHMNLVSGDGLGLNDLNDILEAANYAQKLKYVDLSRGVGIGGRSWGGYLTLMALTQAPDVFSCGVAGAAIVDWTIQQSETEVRYYDRWLVGGWIYEQKQRVLERSPISYVEKVTAPLLVYHGEKDIDVPFSQISSFVKKMKEAGKEVEFISYPKEGHGNTLPKNQADVLQRTSRFFKKHLQAWDLLYNPTGNQVPYV